MIVLGFDTATPGTAVGLALADGSVLEAYDDPHPDERPGHATRLLPLADGLLAQAGLDWHELERLAVGVGPGTFTGLRIGVSTARGLAQSLGAELVGVSTLRALALGTLRAPLGGERGVLATIDARRGEAFVGGYSADGGLLAPCALAPEDFGRVLGGSPSGAPFARSRPLAVGDGAVRYRTHLEDLGIEVPEDSSALHRVRGACICELALDATPVESGNVLPDYLRRPDAELALEAAAAAAGASSGAVG